jgi:hypothetical protein
LATFIAHQSIGTFGVAVFAYLLGISLHDLAAQLGAAYSMRPVYFILTETPYFPVQIVLGLWFGWLLGKRFGHRSMNYVWVLPALVLCCAVLLFAVLSPSYHSVLANQPSPLSRFFGWGCQPKNHCLDQLVTTMPFYASSSYSLGAWFARQLGQKNERQAT